MFHHVKDLQFDARVSQPDARFAGLLLEQFGGGNGELKAAMQYFVQAFNCRKPYPDKYDLLMDIATEEFSHLEIVGATITMLLDGINGELKDAATSERNGWMRVLGGRQEKDAVIHEAMLSPQFLTVTGGGPAVTNCQGVPWSGSFVNANGDLTVDLRSNIGAESRAKIVYEYLMQFTDDPHVKETLQFLMTREVAHFKMFAAALEDIVPNFPPGILQGDVRYSNTYYNLSNGAEVRGSWNQGAGLDGEPWEYVDDPIVQVITSHGQTQKASTVRTRTASDAEAAQRSLGRMRSQHIKDAVGSGETAWSSYSTDEV